MPRPSIVKVYGGLLNDVDVLHGQTVPDARGAPNPTDVHVDGTALLM